MKNLSAYELSAYGANVYQSSAYGPLSGGAVVVPPFGGHATLLNGLMALWKLDEVSGNRVDVIGGYVATDVNANVSSAVGINGNAASYGTTSRLAVAYNVANYPGQNGTGCTFSAWVKRNANPSTNFSRVTEEAVASGAFGMTVNSSGKLQGFCRVGASVNLAVGGGATTVTDNAWHLLTLLHDTTAGKVRTYVDAALQATSASTNTGNLVNNSVGYTIGYSHQLPTFYNADNATVCLIDEFGVWDRWLTAQEITDQWALGAGVFY